MCPIMLRRTEKILDGPEAVSGLCLILDSG